MSFSLSSLWISHSHKKKKKKLQPQTVATVKLQSVSTVRTAEQTRAQRLISTVVSLLSLARWDVAVEELIFFGGEVWNAMNKT